MLKFLKRNKRKDEAFSEYPCRVFLHNALRFISDNKPNAAYEDICYALLRSGDNLSDCERAIFEKIKAEREV